MTIEQPIAHPRFIVWSAPVRLTQPNAVACGDQGARTCSGARKRLRWSMMTTLLEDPTPIIVLGILAEAILGVLLVQTRRGFWLWPMAGVLAVVAIGVIVERLVVTERERVEAAIYGAARAVEENDRDGVATFLARSASDVLRRATYYMGRFEFSSVTLRSMEITINELTSPPTAQATFFAKADFTDRQGEYMYPSYAANFTVELVREDGVWKIRSAEDDNLSPLMRDIR